MDAACTIQDSIHVFSLVRKYVSRILGTYQIGFSGGSIMRCGCVSGICWKPDKYRILRRRSQTGYR